MTLEKLVTVSDAFSQAYIGLPRIGLMSPSMGLTPPPPVGGSRNGLTPPPPVGGSRNGLTPPPPVR